MNNNLRPGAIMTLAGGVLLFISVFLNWVSVDFGEFGGSVDYSGTETNAWGFLGIFMLLIGAALAAVAAIRAFAPQVNLPSQLLGFTLDQLILMLGFAAFLAMFGLQFRSEVAFGVTLGWIGAGVATAGAFMESRGMGAKSTSPPAPPSSF